MRIIDSKRWLKAMKKSKESPKVRPEGGDKADSLLVTGFSIFVSVFLCLIISYILDAYLWFLYIPILVVFYILERKHIL